MAALVVGGLGAAVGLSGWVAALVAVAALLIGAALAAWLFARAERSAATATRRPEGFEGRSVFRLEGEYWTISFQGGSTIHLPRSKGLRYVDRLLRHPNVEVHVLDLAAMHQPAVVSGRKEDLHVEGSTRDPVLDQEALRQFRRRVEDLDEEIAEAERNSDAERGAIAREERERILDEVRRNIRPDGSPRDHVDEVERARVNVTKAIKSAIQKIREQDPSLGHHLDHDIRTGTYCAYEPDPATAPDWV